MSSKLLYPTIGLMLIVLLLTGCSRAPVGPTATPTFILPTPTPACGLECTGSRGVMPNQGPSLSIEITCESGQYTQSLSSRQSWDDDRGWVYYLEGTRTYEDTGNKYEITADASEYMSADNTIKVMYHVEVIGGVFGETAQICESE